MMVIGESFGFMASLLRFFKGAVTSVDTANLWILDIGRRSWVLGASKNE